METDTSTYPRAAPPQQQNPLDQIGKLQEMGLRQQQSQKNAIGIDQEKLKLVNQKWELNSKRLGELSEKGRTQQLGPEDLIDAYQDMVNYGGKTSDQYAKSVSSIKTMAEIKRDNPGATPEQLKGMMHEYISGRGRAEQIKGASIMDAINTVHGAPGTVADGQYTRGIVTSPFFGVQPKGAAFGQQNAPGLPTATPEGTQAFGQQPLSPPVQQGVPTPRPRLPVDTSSAVNPRTVNGQPQNLTGPVIPPKASGPMLSQPYTFDEGKKQYAAGIEQAGRTLQGIKPAQQALKLMDPEVIKGLTGTGPIAENASKILGALQGVGILKESGPVAQRQELVKKLAYYLKNSPSGQRSDAAQELATKASANPDVQLLPALINITRDNIALDRVDAAKSLSFQRGVENKQYGKFLEHQGSFPNDTDERAFKLDLMPEKERNEFLDNLEKNESKSKLAKFKKSYDLAKQLRMFE